MVVTRCCAWYLLVVSAPLMRTLAVAPPCGPVDCAEASRCWGVPRPIQQEVFAPVPLSLSCDFKTAGGGWTILQQRRDYSIDFYRKWSEYKRGFGTVDTFWLGLDHVRRLTEGHELTLRVEVTRGRYRHTEFAEYDGFTLSNETTSYALNYSLYNRRSTLADGLINHTGPFCCWDSPYSEPCRRKAMYGRTSWWFGSQGPFNSDLNAALNGKVQQQQVYWRGVSDIVATQIKFRPSMFGLVAANCSKSCPNGGTCLRASNTTFYCRCAFGYTGRRCESSFVPVVPCFCFNGGTCLTDRACICPAGYRGVNCGEKIPTRPPSAGGGLAPGNDSRDDPGKFKDWLSISGLTVLIIGVLSVLLLLVFLCCACKYACASHNDASSYDPDYGYNEKHLDYGYNEQRQDHGYNEQHLDYGYNEQRPDYGYNEQRPDYGYNEQRQEYGYNEQRQDYGYNEQRQDNGYNEQRQDYGYNEQQRLLQNNY